MIGKDFTNFFAKLIDKLILAPIRYLLPKNQTKKILPLSLAAAPLNPGTYLTPLTKKEKEWLKNQEILLGSEDKISIARVCIEILATNNITGLIGITVNSPALFNFCRSDLKLRATWEKAISSSLITEVHQTVYDEKATPLRKEIVIYEPETPKIGNLFDFICGRVLQDYSTEPDITLPQKAGLLICSAKFGNILALTTIISRLYSQIGEEIGKKGSAYSKKHAYSTTQALIHYADIAITKSEEIGYLLRSFLYLSLSYFYENQMKEDGSVSHNQTICCGVLCYLDLKQAIAVDGYCREEMHNAFLGQNPVRFLAKVFLPLARALKIETLSDFLAYVEQRFDDQICTWAKMLQAANLGNGSKIPTLLRSYMINEPEKLAPAAEHLSKRCLLGKSYFPFWIKSQEENMRKIASLEDDTMLKHRFT